MEPPTNIKELCSFLGMVTYYRDMWPRRSHILAPLTSLLKVKEFCWGSKKQKAFSEMKALMATVAILVYLDHNLGFDINADASDYQLGVVIEQNRRPVAHCSWKLSAAQKNCTTIEKELLSVAETLCTFCSMLLGTRLQLTRIIKISHTNSPNLLCNVLCAGVHSLRSMDPHSYIRKEVKTASPMP